MARKPATKSSSASSSRKSVGSRDLHPQRTGIVWSIFIGAMTLSCAALLSSDGFKSVPLTTLTETVVVPAPRVEIEPGRWQAIVIHHSGSHTGSAEMIARQQAHDWGVPSLGYHIVIGNGNGQHDGEAIWGPRWYAQEGGAHVANREPGKLPDAAWLNQNAIGICLIGNGEKHEFTEAQMQSLTSIVRDLQKRCGIPSSQVFLHSDLLPIASPGSKFPREMFAVEISG